MTPHFLPIVSAAALRRLAVAVCLAAVVGIHGPCEAAQPPLRDGEVISVIGDVETPGQISLPVDGRLTVGSAVRQSGLLSESATAYVVKERSTPQQSTFVSRQSGGDDWFLQSGDIVIVRSSDGRIQPELSNALVSAFGRRQVVYFHQEVPAGDVLSQSGIPHGALLQGRLICAALNRRGTAQPQLSTILRHGDALILKSPVSSSQPAGRISQSEAMHSVPSHPAEMNLQTAAAVTPSAVTPVNAQFNEAPAAALPDQWTSATYDAEMPQISSQNAPLHEAAWQLQVPSESNSPLAVDDDNASGGAGLTIPQLPPGNPESGLGILSPSENPEAKSPPADSRAADFLPNEDSLATTTVAAEETGLFSENALFLAGLFISASLILAGWLKGRSEETAGATTSLHDKPAATSETNPSPITSRPAAQPDAAHYSSIELQAPVNAHLKVPANPSESMGLPVESDDLLPTASYTVPDTIIPPLCEESSAPEDSDPQPHAVPPQEHVEATTRTLSDGPWFDRSWRSDAVAETQESYQDYESRADVYAIRRDPETSIPDQAETIEASIERLASAVTEELDECDVLSLARAASSNILNAKSDRLDEQDQETTVEPHAASVIQTTEPASAEEAARETQTAHQDNPMTDDDTAVEWRSMKNADLTTAKQETSVPVADDHGTIASIEPVGSVPEEKSPAAENGLEELIRNRLPVDLEAVSLPLRVSLFGRPAGPIRLRIDPAHTELRGPHQKTLDAITGSARQPTAASEHGDTMAPAGKSNSGRIDRTDSGEASPASRTISKQRSATGFDQALNSLHGRTE